MYLNNKHTRRMYWCVSERATMFRFTYISCVVNNVLQRHMSSCFKCIVAESFSQWNSFILKYGLIAERVKNTGWAFPLFLLLQTFITRKQRGIQTYFFFQNVTQLKKFFYNTLVHFNMWSFLLHGERLIDNQFLSTCSPTCLQLL